jgi:dTDP-4-amino-4,6-dideoxygalactose transaminase
MIDPGRTLVPFNKPHLCGTELHHVAQAHAKGQLSGDGAYTRMCNEWLVSNVGCKKALLTHSCTAALEMAAILADIGPGDEVIMPSYTFVSTANAFALRGGVPVFVDVRRDTLNLDENLIEQAITPRTKAIVPVHYAGVSCQMDAIMEIARRHRLVVVEDAAQGLMSRYRGRPVGSVGDLACLSFHETKNITSGEGGALLINDERLCERAEIIREKGTNRSRFLRGQVDKYTWVDLGSSYLPGEIVAAFLWAQLSVADRITDRRRSIWSTYHERFRLLEESGKLERPRVPADCEHNAHMYYLLLRDIEVRSAFIDFMKGKGIGCVFHYVPLHQSPMGTACGRASGDLPNTESLHGRLVRLPLWYDLTDALVHEVSDSVADFVRSG